MIFSDPSWFERWKRCPASATRPGPTGGGTPLIAEGTGASLLGFLIGLLLAYLVELRRRYNAQWNW